MVLKQKITNLKILENLEIWKSGNLKFVFGKDNEKANFGILWESQILSVQIVLHPESNPKMFEPLPLV